MKQRRSVPYETRQRNITSLFGYGVFSLLVITTLLITTVPLTMILFTPGVKYENVLAILITFTASAIVPFLVAYIIGDKSTRLKNRGLHHYNGVLFGVAAVWLTQALQVLSSPLYGQLLENIPQLWLVYIVNTWPVAVTIIVLAIIAFLFHHKPQKAHDSVLTFRPYQILLYVSVAVAILASQLYVDPEQRLIGLLGLAIPLVLIIISYAVVRNLAIAIVAYTFAFLAMQFSGQLATLLPYSSLAILLGFLPGIVVWIVYLWLMRRAPKSRR